MKALKKIKNYIKRKQEELQKDWDYLNEIKIEVEMEKEQGMKADKNKKIKEEFQNKLKENDKLTLELIRDWLGKDGFAKDEIKGKTKIAMILGCLEDDFAKDIVNKLDEVEREILIKEVTKLPQLEIDKIHKIFKSFVYELDNLKCGCETDKIEPNLDYGIQNHNKEVIGMKLLEGDISNNELDKMMGKIYADYAKPFESLKRLRDVTPLYCYIKDEEDILIATVMNHMKPSQAAEMLEKFDGIKKVRIIEKIALIEKQSKNDLLDIEHILNEKLETFIANTYNEKDGVKTIINILNNASRQTERDVFNELEKENKDLSNTIKNNFFLFDDVMELDDSSMQKVVNKITDNEMLAKALKGMTQELKARLLSAMTKRRKVLVEDSEENLGNISKSDIHEAQEHIVNVVRMLEKQNDIVIKKGEEDNDI